MNATATSRGERSGCSSASWTILSRTSSGMRFQTRCGNRYRPEGEWVQTTPLLDVVAVKYHKPAALAFAAAAKKAERRGRLYGLLLEPEATNSRDHNAIKVIGLVVQKGWLLGERDQRWHIGYVPSEFASELVEGLFEPGHPYAAELYGIYVNRDYVDIEFFVLVPKGSDASLRKPRRIAETARGPDPSLTRERSASAASALPLSVPPDRVM